MTYDHPGTSETVLYTIPHWAIVNLQYSVQNKTRLFIYHNCDAIPNATATDWRYARWDPSYYTINSPIKCWTCDKPIPEDIQTLYILLSMK